MEYNSKNADGRDLLHSDFPLFYTHVKGWQMRKKGHIIGRTPVAVPTQGEHFYLRNLLTMKRGATSYRDLYTMNGVSYNCPSAAFRAAGLTFDDSEWISLFDEIKDSSSASSLRQTFASALSHSHINDLQQIWDRFKTVFSDDFPRRLLIAVPLRPRIMGPAHEWTVRQNNMFLEDALTLIVLRTVDKTLRDITKIKNEMFGGIPVVVVGESNRRFADWLSILSYTPSLYGDITLPSWIRTTDDRELFRNFVYPTNQLRNLDESILRERAILTSRNDNVSRFNNEILQLVNIDSRDYFAVDRVQNDESGHISDYPPEFIQSITGRGLPDGKITLQVGMPKTLLGVRGAGQNSNRLKPLSYQAIPPFMALIIKFNTYQGPCSFSVGPIISTAFFAAYSDS
ncbi:hypothetical protein EPUL_005210, partial [Erysiphe pulchra]